MDILHIAREDALKSLHSQRNDREAVYAFNSDISSISNSFKVGMTTNVWQREKGYNTLAPQGRMVFYTFCENASIVEKTIFKVLRQQYRVKGEVVYDIPLDVLKNVILHVISETNKLFQRPVTQNIDCLSAVALAPPAQQPPRRSRMQVSSMLRDDQKLVQEGEREEETEDIEDTEETVPCRIAPPVDEQSEKFLYRNKPAAFRELQQNRRRMAWSAEEDQALLDEINSRGLPITGGWGMISKKIPTRVGYQCQGRYRKLVAEGIIRIPGNT